MFRSPISSVVASACLISLVALIALASTLPAHAWESSHGDRAGTGFVDVKTAPAKTAPITVPNIGSFAIGVAPVVAPDGTVYIGNAQGKLLAFRANGKPYWQRNISLGFSILSSATIGQDGIVYVVGVHHLRDHSVTPKVDRIDVELNAFTASGGWLWHVPIVTPTPDFFDNTLAGAPNIWQSGGSDIVMIPLAYRNKVTKKYTTHLYAYTPGGGLAGETKVAEAVSLGLTSENDLPPYGFEADPPGPQPYSLPEGTVAPFPGPAIFTFQGGGTPFILVSDGFQHQVGLTFSGNVFQEIFRVSEESNDHTMSAPPIVLPDGHSVISTWTGLRFAGPSGIAIPLVPDVQSEAAPTLLPDGRIAVVSRFGRHDDSHFYYSRDLKVIQNGTLLPAIPLEGDSIVPAAASRNHLFVSTENAFLTFDNHTLAKVAEINWVGGGTIAPAIGPTGYVYAMASNILFVFPPPRFTPPSDVTNQLKAVGGQGVTSNDLAPPDTDAATTGQDLTEMQPAQPEPGAPESGTQVATGEPAATSQRFDPPMTAHGNRLSACSDAAGKHCGKDIAQAFCQVQGFTTASDVDIDDHKVTAETLDGALCTKKKCQVFDHVTCSR